MSEFLVEQFNNNGYVHLPEFLDLDNCKELTEALNKHIRDGLSHKDEQSPLSEAIYASETSDSLLEQLLPYFEQACGKKLFPTYSYARLYAEGDDLKPHIDRPACEISATLTVGFDSAPWPIYMADKTSDQSGDKYISSSNDEWYLTNISKIDMKVGDAVLYRGMDKVHWRENLQGKWQAQIFLHYVDAAGKHADWIYDKKEKLAHHPIKEEEDAIYWAYEDGFSLDSCAKLIESCESQLETQKAFIGDKQINLNVRDVNKIILPAYRGIGATLAGMGLNANVQNWNFALDAANQTEYLKYDENGHYVSHIDTFLRPNARSKEPTRKLTVLAFLNDDFEGGRLYLQIGHEKIYPPQKAGTVIVFPSFILHGVEPVTKGIRRSVVTWLVGPWFK